MPEHGRAEAAIARFPAITFVKALLGPDRRAFYYVPDNKGLRLVPEPGGFRVEADFQTDIRDPEVRRVVKASIEDYWRGEFSYGGKTLRLRARVTIRPLAEGEPFAPERLQLVDGKDADLTSVTSESRVTLSRLFRYDTPAHEFGHVLGLVDDYREDYDPGTRSAVYTRLPGSLMSSSDGSLQPRHLKLAYQLLRRRRLVRPD
ncbi:MAG: hypothetical protein PHF00_06090 [Elusimicrobia bacterium]|nr:hypothetical protein [Elusimicrobiota bacterium]